MPWFECCGGSGGGSLSVQTYTGTPSSTVKDQEYASCTLTKVDVGNAVIININVSSMHINTISTSTEYTTVFTFASGVLSDLNLKVIPMFCTSGNNLVFARLRIADGSNNLSVYYGGSAGWYNANETYIIPKS